MMATAMATPSPPSAEDATEEKQDEDQLEESATDKDDKEGGDTLEVPAY
jgi:hypothetical protein